VENSLIARFNSLGPALGRRWSADARRSSASRQILAHDAVGLIYKRHIPSKRLVAGARREAIEDRGSCHADILSPNEVKNLTRMVDSMYNGWRIEDVWLDR